MTDQPGVIDTDLSAIPQSPAEPTSQPAPIAFNTSDLGADLALPPAGMMSGTPEVDAQEYGFDNDDIRQYDFEIYKGHKGITDRVGVLALPYGARVHFKQGIGYFNCLSKFERRNVAGQSIEVCSKRASCCVHCDTPRKRFILPIIQYATQPTGALLPQFSYVLKAWLYSDDKYIQMRTINSEFPLLNHDLLLTCTDENYGKITMAACREAVWKNPKLPAEFHAEVKTWVEQMRPKMVKKIGRKITEQEFLTKAGLAPTPTVVPGSDAPLVDLRELLA